MSVSASFTSASGLKSGMSGVREVKTRHCDKCKVSLAKVVCAGYYCVDCFTLLTKRRFRDTLNRRCGLRKYARAVVGFSGGISSSCTLEILSSLGSTNCISEELLGAKKLPNVDAHLFQNEDFPLTSTIIIPHEDEDELGVNTEVSVEMRKNDIGNNADKDSFPLRILPIYIDDSFVYDAFDSVSARAVEEERQKANSSDDYEDGSSASLPSLLRPNWVTAKGETISTPLPPITFPCIRYISLYKNSHSRESTTLVASSSICPILCIPLSAAVPTTLSLQLALSRDEPAASSRQNLASIREQALLTILNRFPSATQKQDYLETIRGSLLARASALLGCSRVITGTNAGTLSSTLVADLTKARGFSLPHDLAYIDFRPVSIHGGDELAILSTISSEDSAASLFIAANDRISGSFDDIDRPTSRRMIRILRPCRDILPKAIAVYATYRGVLYAPSRGLSSREEVSKNTGLNALSSFFLYNLQSHNESTMYNVIRTCEKLSIAPLEQAKAEQYAQRQQRQQANRVTKETTTVEQRREFGKKVTAAFLLPEGDEEDQNGDEVGEEYTETKNNGNNDDENDDENDDDDGPTCGSSDSISPGLHSSKKSYSKTCGTRSENEERESACGSTSCCSTSTSSSMCASTTSVTSIASEPEKIKTNSERNGKLVKKSNPHAAGIVAVITPQSDEWYGSRCLCCVRAIVTMPEAIVPQLRLLKELPRPGDHLKQQSQRSQQSASLTSNVFCGPCEDMLESLAPTRDQRRKLEDTKTKLEMHVSEEDLDLQREYAEALEIVKVAEQMHRNACLILAFPYVV